MRTNEQIRAELLAKAAGVVLDLEKNRFVISNEMLTKLVNKISRLEYVRGWNEEKCAGCQNKSVKRLFRPYEQPDLVWDFCENCARRKHLMKMRHFNDN